MPRAPLLRPKEVVRTFEKFGWRVVRQRGSHIILIKEGRIASLSVPNHREVARGTLKALILRAGLTIEEFVGAL